MNLAMRLFRQNVRGLCKGWRERAFSVYRNYNKRDKKYRRNRLCKIPGYDKKDCWTVHWGIPLRKKEKFFGKLEFSDDVLDEKQQEVAAELNEAESFVQTMYGTKRW